MFESFMKCLRKGGKAKKGCVYVKISDLYSRCPADQRKQLQVFASKTEEYKKRVRKYPGKLPPIDWAYYKTNVRPEYVSWVKEYERQYDTLDSLFANRHTTIDHSKYFGELEKQTEQVKKEVVEFKKESEERIKCLEKRMEHLKGLKPYTEMTMEEYCDAFPDIAPDFRNRPTFWPHTPEEQIPGPSGGPDAGRHDEEHEGDKPTTKGDDKDPKKPPPSADSKEKTAVEAKADASKKSKESDVPKDAKETKESKEKERKEAEDGKDAKGVKDTKDGKDTKDTKKDKEEETCQRSKDRTVAKATSTESHAAEAVTQMAEKGIGMAKDLVAKAVVVFKNLFQKIGEKRKEVAASAAAARQNDQQSAYKSESKKAVQDKGDDLKREAQSNICNKTIIRGEETVKADVKPHHKNLAIEADIDDCKTQDKPAPEEIKCEEVIKEPICPEKVKEKPDGDKQEVCLTSDEKKDSEKKLICSEDIKEDGKTDTKPDCSNKVDKDVSESKSECPEEKKKSEVQICFDQVMTELKEKSKDSDCIGSVKDQKTEIQPKAPDDKGSLDQTETKPPVSESTEQKSEMGFVGPMPEPKVNAEAIKPEALSTASLPIKIDHSPSIVGMEHPSKIPSVTDKVELGTKLDADKNANPIEIPKSDKLPTTCDDPKATSDDSGAKQSDAHKLQGQQEKSISESDVYNFLDDKAKPGSDPKSVINNIGSNEIAALMFRMATNAATLLAEAKKIIDEAQIESKGNASQLQAAYEAAEKQISEALGQAFKAVASANELTKRVESITDAEEKNIASVIEKHTKLAKILAERAINMKKEISKLLNDLKKDL